MRVGSKLLAAEVEAEQQCFSLGQTNSGYSSASVWLPCALRCAVLCCAVLCCAVLGLCQLTPGPHTACAEEGCCDLPSESHARPRDATAPDAATGLLTVDTGAVPRASCQEQAPRRERCCYYHAGCDQEENDSHAISEAARRGFEDAAAAPGVARAGQAED